MRKNFGQKTWFYPLPVLIVGTFDEKGQANAMNAAWGGIYGVNKVILCLTETHKTTQNIIARGAFTISFADEKNVVASDYVGLESANKISNKMEKAGFTTTKSEFVNAPIINELPLTLECKLEKVLMDGNLVGEIVNVSASEDVLDENGNVDSSKVNAIAFDPVNATYVKMGGIVGNAFKDGASLK